LSLREVRKNVAERPSLLGMQQVGVEIVMVLCDGVAFRLVERIDGDGPAVVAGKSQAFVAGCGDDPCGQGARFSDAIEMFDEAQTDGLANVLDVGVVEPVAAGDGADEW
jgi:hypothetical protein